MTSLAPILVAFYFLFVGTFFLYQNKNSKLARALFLLCLTTFGWQALFAAMFQMTNYNNAVIAMKISWTFILFLPTSIYYFLILVSEKDDELKWVYFSYILSTFFIIPLWFSNYFMNGLGVHFWGYYPNGNILELVHIAQTFLTIVRGLYVTYKVMDVNDKIKKELRKYSFVGSGIYLFSALDYTQNFGLEIYPCGVFFIAIGLTFITYGLVKNRLFDFNLATSLLVSRLVSYGILFVIFLVFCFFLTRKFFLGTKTFSLFILLFIAFACEAYVFVKQKIQQFSDRLLVKERDNYHKLVNIINENLEVATSLEGLFHFIKNFIPEAFDSKLTHFYIKDDFFDEGNNRNEYHLFGDEKTAVILSDVIIAKASKSRACINSLDLEKENLINLENNSIMVPFIVLGRVIGFILITPNNSSFGYWQNEIFSILISQAGMALDRIKAYRKISLQKEELLKQKIDLTKSLAGSIAHEMRNPLNAINLSLNEISEAVDKNDLEKISEYQLISQNSIRRANQVINIILAELRDKKLDPHDFTNISIQELVKKVITEYGYNSTEEKSRIKLNIKEDFVIKADETLLIYVFFNLIKNALYYPNSTITISAFAEPDYNYVTIHDNGPGIAQENLETLFKDFSSSGKKGGTGLGLVFCKRTMNDFSGDILCESELGKYTKFILKLPITEEVPINKTSRSFDSSISLNNKKILLVDDQKINRLLTAKFLTKQNIIVHEAENGEEAIKKASQENYDLILMDIEMPIMNGISATKHLRQTLNLQIPIIAITGDDNQERLEEIKNSGFDDYFAKGGDCSFLLKIILGTISV